jgi:hypothetical protein
VVRLHGWLCPVVLHLSLAIDPQRQIFLSITTTKKTFQSTHVPVDELVQWCYWYRMVLLLKWWCLPPASYTITWGWFPVACEETSDGQQSHLRSSVVHLLALWSPPLLFLLKKWLCLFLPIRTSLPREPDKHLKIGIYLVMSKWPQSICYREIADFALKWRCQEEFREVLWMKTLLQVLYLNASFRISHYFFELTFFFSKTHLNFSCFKMKVMFLIMQLLGAYAFLQKL